MATARAQFNTEAGRRQSAVDWKRAILDDRGAWLPWKRPGTFRAVHAWFTRVLRGMPQEAWEIEAHLSGKPPSQSVGAVCAPSRPTWRPRASRAPPALPAASAGLPSADAQPLPAISALAQAAGAVGGSAVSDPPAGRLSFLPLFRGVPFLEQRGQVWLPSLATAPLLGEGTFGLVSRVRRHAGGPEYALKEFKPHPRAAADFQIEVHALLAVAGQEGFPTLVDMCKVRGNYAIVMTVHGESLDRVLAATGPLSAPDLRRMILQLCRALAYLHDARSLIHADVKPANVLINGVSGARQATLADLGTVVEAHPFSFPPVLPPPAAAPLVLGPPPGSAPGPQRPIASMPRFSGTGAGRRGVRQRVRRAGPISGGGLEVHGKSRLPAGAKIRVRISMGRSGLSWGSAGARRCGRGR